MLKQDPNYKILDVQAKESIRKFLEISKTANVIILVEDNESSIISTSPGMIMKDSMGMLHQALVRCDVIEADSFRYRKAKVAEMAAAENEAVINTAQSGKLN